VPPKMVSRATCVEALDFGVRGQEPYQLRGLFGSLLALLFEAMESERRVAMLGEMMDAAGWGVRDWRSFGVRGLVPASVEDEACLVEDDLVDTALFVIDVLSEAVLLCGATFLPGMAVTGGPPSFVTSSPSAPSRRALLRGPMTNTDRMSNQISPGTSLSKICALRPPLPASPFQVVMSWTDAATGSCCLIARGLGASAVVTSTELCPT
jgi:hypothetical protein